MGKSTTVQKDTPSVQSSYTPPASMEVNVDTKFLQCWKDIQQWMLNDPHGTPDIASVNYWADAHKVPVFIVERMVFKVIQCIINLFKVLTSFSNVQ